MYGLVEVTKSGLLENSTTVVLGKSCSTCSCWFPATHEYFYRNGQLKDKHRLDSYCASCRKIKTAIEADLKASGKSNTDVADKIRKQFESGERLRVQPRNIHLIYEYQPGVVTLFTERFERLAKDAATHDSSVASWIANHYVKAS